MPDHNQDIKRRVVALALQGRKSVYVNFGQNPSTLRETNMEPQKENSFPNHQFSGAMLVSGSVTDWSSEKISWERDEIWDTKKKNTWITWDSCFFELCTKKKPMSHALDFLKEDSKVEFQKTMTYPKQERNIIIKMRRRQDGTAKLYPNRTQPKQWEPCYVTKWWNFPYKMHILIIHLQQSSSSASHTTSPFAEFPPTVAPAPLGGKCFSNAEIKGL